mmetsp:Transcript_20366/g.42481  ORF Transcript_20366/g.42481 Transcript_20366/m.42481 type:complete len:251 (-) Transcript_20366:85-837(-)
MSGDGFLLATTSPAKIVNLVARSPPRSVCTRFVTAFSLEVEQTASVFPVAIASSINRSTPGRRGTTPSPMRSLKIFVFASWSSLTRACLSFSSSEKDSGHPTAFQWAVIRSFPPPTSRSFPYPSTVHSVSRLCFSKTRLNATRWASRSVSARTPSMSHSMASREGAGSAVAAACRLVAVAVKVFPERKASAVDANARDVATTNDACAEIFICSLFGVWYLFFWSCRRRSLDTYTWYRVSIIVVQVGLDWI